MLLFQSFAQNFEPTFETAYIVGDLQTMEKLYKKSDRDNFYLDCALEEGRLEIVDFFIQRQVKPSLFAYQMSRINGFHSITNKISEFRNKVNLKNVYWNYDPSKKDFEWNSCVPTNHRF
jgi:hypothetical protein